MLTKLLADITAEGSTPETFDRRLEIRMLLNMDSPVETKTAAPRSWETAQCQCMLYKLD
jgi:hypothetical protein